ncbi:MAG: HDOD domain-containing protein, partial [Myxococcota bacterium]
SEPVTSVELAVPRLGVDVVKAIALAFETSDRVSSALGGIVDTLSQHALEVAAICRNFAANVAERELAFTVGLMHDVGLLVKLALGDSPISFVHHHNGEPGSPKLGAYILGLWGLPQPIVEAVAYQDDPGQIRTEPNLARWVHVASRVAMDQPVEDENAAELVHIARAAYGRIRRVTAA